jgi:hypothetical protein
VAGFEAPGDSKVRDALGVVVRFLVSVERGERAAGGVQVLAVPGPLVEALDFEPDFERDVSLFSHE